RAMRLAATIDRLPPPVRQVLASRLWRRLPTPGLPKNRRRRLQRLAATFSTPSNRRYAEIISIFNEIQRAHLYSEDFLAQLPDHDPADFVGAALARAR